MPLLALENVSKRFDGITAVDGVSFAVDRGEVVGVLGPNGAGKTTMMRLVTQYYEPDAGTIRLNGRPLEETGRDAKRRIGYLPENNPLYGDMLVVEYLDFIARLRDLDARVRLRAIDEAVGQTGIAEAYYRPIADLSKGYRQRVGLAQAILHRPDLLILDEPTEGLDPNQRVEIRRLVRELGQDRTVLLSTHVLPEVQQTCSRLLVLHRGRIAADGGVEELTAQAGAGTVRVTVEVEGDGVADRLGALPGVRDVMLTGERAGRTAVTLTADATPDVRPAVFALARDQDWTLYELHQEARGLEELFRELTAGDGEDSEGAAP